jgi:hypothetical protein
MEGLAQRESTSCSRVPSRQVVMVVPDLPPEPPPLAAPAVLPDHPLATCVALQLSHRHHDHQSWTSKRKHLKGADESNSNGNRAELEVITQKRDGQSRANKGQGGSLSVSAFSKNTYWKENRNHSRAKRKCQRNRKKTRTFTQPYKSLWRMELYQPKRWCALWPLGVPQAGSRN